MIVGALFGASLLLVLPAAFGLDFSRLQQSLIGRFGEARLPLFADWQRLLAEGHGLGEPEKLRQVNDFFNRRVAFDDDISIWQQSDYWATPLETIGSGRADCEDFSIAKYYSLLEMGVPVGKLRLVYVRARQNGPAGPTLQAHMVLAYYASPNAEPLVLDNLRPEIAPASRRTDLSPIFSFNSAGLWQGTGNQSSKSNLSRWQDLLSRARAEGFE
ncbi:MAG: transglutaminase [Betaproteobacteria bacterium HGW-Betaproteobacteria-12]|nr:MAG: transglutaminase [Betaproteobacteria bacterium HGW-Betaproteobacteria-12]